MKELLNKLIEKGRVPFWDKRITNVNGKMQHIWTYNWVFWSNHNLVEIRKSTRELASKESWLWQFVCENGMYNKLEISDNRTKNYDAYYNESDDTYSWDDYGYRLIESALCDEDKLEEFLLNNIKI